MTDYSITLPSYSIGEQVYKQIPTVCAPFGATAVVIGGHKAMAAVRERLTDIRYFYMNLLFFQYLDGIQVMNIGRRYAIRQWRQQI